MNIKIRLKQYLDLKGITDYRFQKDIGVTNGYLTKGSTIRSDYLEKILVEYKDLSLAWLLTGDGDMIKKDEEISITNESQISSTNIPEDRKAWNTIDRNSKNIEKMIEISDRNSVSIQELVESNKMLIGLLCQNGYSVRKEDEKTKKGASEDSKRDTADESYSGKAG